MQIPIRMQADDFLNAYHILHKHNESIAPTALVPAVVILAFAVELYFKDIYSLLNKEVPRTHKILELFEGLDEEIRNDIFNHDSIIQNPFHTRGNIFKRYATKYEGFVSGIEEISESFIQWRYPHDQKRASLQYNSSFAEDLVEALRSVSDNLHASFKKA